MLGSRGNLIRSIVIVLIVIGMGAIVYFFYGFMSNRVTENLRAESQNRLAVFAGVMKGDIQKHTIVPRILNRDERVAIGFFIRTETLNDEFARIAGELEDPLIYTVSNNYSVLNASDPEMVGNAFEPQVILDQAITNGASNFYIIDTHQYYSAMRVDDPITEIPLGAIMIQIDFERYRAMWRRFGANIALVQGNGDILLATNSQFEGQNILELFGRAPDTPIDQALFERVYTINDSEEFVLQSELAMNDGWKLVMFSPAANVQQQLRISMALLILTLASLILFSLYLISRRAALASARLKREGEELRALNAKLISEIEQRQIAEANLQTAEQSLEQSAKLAAIGQMSAAVGHELNQPLAAMRTYLTTLRMLLRRNRFVEAGGNLNRIEDLMERMGSITRQMRSFARNVEGEYSEFDLRDAVLNSFELMSPQFGQRKLNIKRDISEKPVMVYGDRIRVEQILVNILRNAVEATSAEDDPTIEITLRAGETKATIMIADNGMGIENIDQLFEPFYTTKAPGEGLGLGLAISAGYARDMGGNLLARQNRPKGAVFELNLPLARHKLTTETHNQTGEQADDGN